MEYGYVRVSTPNQKVGRQIENIRKFYPQAIIFSEAYTGTEMNRPEWNKLMKRVKEGDYIIVDEVSRMSRTAKEGFACYKDLYERGVDLIFLKEPYINTSSYRKAIDGFINCKINETGNKLTDELLAAILDAINNFMLHKIEEDIFAAFVSSQKEVDYLHQRTKEGMEQARRSGKLIGCPPGKQKKIKKAEDAKAFIAKKNKSFGGPLSDFECQKLCGISRNSFYKYKKEIKECALIKNFQNV